MCRIPVEIKNIRPAAAAVEVHRAQIKVALRPVRHHPPEQRLVESRKVVHLDIRRGPEVMRRRVHEVVRGAALRGRPAARGRIVLDSSSALARHSGITGGNLTMPFEAEI